MTRQSKLLALPLILTLAACGGGGGGSVSSVASAPSPVAATQAPAFALPPTPATTSGNYQTISTVTSFDRAGTVLPLQLAPAGSVSLTVDAATRSYTLTVTAGAYQFPAGQVTMPADSTLGSTRNNPLTTGTIEQFTPAALIARGDLLASTVGAGTGASGAPRVLTTFLRLNNVGQVTGWPRYLSAASWGQSYQENASGVPGAENFSRTTQTTGFLVFGQRTAAGDIPVVGRARYALESFPGQHPSIFGPYTDEDGNRINPDGDTVLEADFATRLLSATYDLTQSFTSDDGGDPIARSVTAVHATGSTSFSSVGTFALLLAGTGSVHVERNDLVPVPDTSRSVSGDITGAFFGPQAAEVGGIWNLPTIDRNGTVSTIDGGFAGVKGP